MTTRAKFEAEYVAYGLSSWTITRLFVRKLLRDETKVTLAAKLGTSRSQLDRQIERGGMSIEQMDNLAVALDVPPANVVREIAKFARYIEPRWRADMSDDEVAALLDSLTLFFS